MSKCSAQFILKQVLRDDFYLVPLLGGIVLSLRGCHTADYWMKFANRSRYFIKCWGWSLEKAPVAFPGSSPALNKSLSAKFAKRLFIPTRPWMGNAQACKRGKKDTDSDPGDEKHAPAAGRLQKFIVHNILEPNFGRGCNEANIIEEN